MMIISNYSRKRDKKKQQCYKTIFTITDSKQVEIVKFI